MIKTTRRPLTFGAYAVNRSDETKGILYLKLYLGEEDDQKPKMVLRPGDRYYKAFKQEIESVWKSGTDYQSPSGVAGSG